MNVNKLLTVALTLALLVGTLPTAAVATAGPVPGSADAEPSVRSGHAVEPTLQTGNGTANATAEGSVNVTVGSQLSTVLAVTDAEVSGELEADAFRFEFEAAGNDSERAEVLADRAAVLRERARNISREYREATAAYESGELTASGYAQRIATLNARAETVVAAAARLEARADTVSALELRAEGYRSAEVDAAVSSLGNVTGVGPSALLSRFTGESRGELEIRTARGLRIEATSEDGERSRQIERARDDDTSFTVAQSDALVTARSALSTPENGTWVLAAAEVKEYEGAYEFAFVLHGAADRTGEAEVRVDGSSGVIYRLEEETERRDDGEDADEADSDRGDDGDGELAVVVSGGSPVPNATVTLTVLAGGEPAADVAVALNDRPVGRTDADGRVRVTLPADGDAKLEARRGDREGELELEFGDDDTDEEESFERSLDATASVEGDAATVWVTYAGDAVAGATVTANGEVVGTTDEDGRLTFETPAVEELELSVTKGEFEAEFTFEADGDGGFALVETDVKGRDAEGDESDEGASDADEADDEGSEGDDESGEDDSDDGDDDSTDTPEPTDTPDPTDTPEDDR